VLQAGKFEAEAITLKAGMMSGQEITRKTSTLNLFHDG
jgi:hypothetical protein